MKNSIKIIKRGEFNCPAAQNEKGVNVSKAERRMAANISAWVREKAEKNNRERQAALRFLFGNAALVTG